jgi:hypothetical protein
MALNESLNNIAQKYAITMAELNRFENSETDFGENIYMTCSRSFDGIGKKIYIIVFQNKKKVFLRGFERSH